MPKPGKKRSRPSKAARLRYHLAQLHKDLGGSSLPDPRVTEVKNSPRAVVKSVVFIPEHSRLNLQPLRTTSRPQTPRTPSPRKQQDLDSDDDVIIILDGDDEVFVPLSPPAKRRR